MKPRERQAQGKGVFDLIEEATHLLRTAPAATLAVYYVGAIPFTLGLLYFWADMSRNPFAPQHLADAALAMAGLFLWMKFWQALFARNLRAQLAAEPPPAWTARRCLRLLLPQIIWQPLGLFLLPAALFPLIPFAWVLAFFQNLTVLADGESSSAGKLAGKSWKLARLWPGQNHLALVVLGAFGFYVFLNWIVVCLALPQLVKLFSGAGSIFTQSPYAMLNSTFFTGMLALTYLCVDPLVKAVYVLRCFYGESLQSGEDLKAEMKPFMKPLAAGAPRVMILLLFLFLAAGRPVVQAAPAAPPATGQIAPGDLDHAINQTIHERRFAWRMPREQIAGDQPREGVIARFLDKAWTMLGHWARAALDWWQALMKKLFPDRPATSYSHDGSDGDWMAPLQLLLYGLVAAALAALAILLHRLWQGRRPSPPVLASEASQPVPDLRDENIRADQLPEDGWTRLAHELLERGEFRLAMRAFYLASLAHLAARNLISIARFKSNREYERELRRRSHAFPEILSLFGDNVFRFERIWYGTHAADLELARQFAAQVERIKAAG